MSGWAENIRENMGSKKFLLGKADMRRRWLVFKVATRRLKREENGEDDVNSCAS